MAKVTSLRSQEDLCVVNFSFLDLELKMVSLSLRDLDVGKDVVLRAKPTNISIAKQTGCEMSLSNKIPSIITNIIQGQILSTICMSHKDVSLQSIITTDSLNSLRLDLGDEIYALIKASDLYIDRVL